MESPFSHNYQRSDTPQYSQSSDSSEQTTSTQVHYTKHSIEHPGRASFEFGSRYRSPANPYNPFENSYALQPLRANAGPLERRTHMLAMEAAVQHQNAQPYVHHDFVQQPVELGQYPSRSYIGRAAQQQAGPHSSKYSDNAMPIDYTQAQLAEAVRELRPRYRPVQRTWKQCFRDFARDHPVAVWAWPIGTVLGVMIVLMSIYSSPLVYHDPHGCQTLACLKLPWMEQGDYVPPHGYVIGAVKHGDKIAGNVTVGVSGGIDDKVFAVGAGVHDRPTIEVDPGEVDTVEVDPVKRDDVDANSRVNIATLIRNARIFNLDPMNELEWTPSILLRSLNPWFDAQTALEWQREVKSLEEELKAKHVVHNPSGLPLLPEVEKMVKANYKKEFEIRKAELKEKFKTEEHKAERKIRHAEKRVQDVKDEWEALSERVVKEALRFNRSVNNTRDMLASEILHYTKVVDDLKLKLDEAPGFESFFMHRNAKKDLKEAEVAMVELGKKVGKEVEVFHKMAIAAREEAEMNIQMAEKYLEKVRSKYAAPTNTTTESDVATQLLAIQTDMAERQAEHHAIMAEHTTSLANTLATPTASDIGGATAHVTAMQEEMESYEEYLADVEVKTAELMEDVAV
ncbi:uncharacterized protein PAC_11634 [Phialocephala subalpina]|uniref:Uncharacterized protein n=1 Tax=Phialocephala subalpina TaxID=576137 RepID=A0A1L7X9T6_9HELO|nr:uncharacterized protein PAC_11634 [Phialocephala subalpina]